MTKFLADISIPVPIFLIIKISKLLRGCKKLLVGTEDTSSRNISTPVVTSFFWCWIILKCLWSN